MDTAEVLRRCEENISLFLCTDEDLAAAKVAATRVCHHDALDHEIALRAKEAKRRARMPRPRKREPVVIHNEREWRGWSFS